MVLPLLLQKVIVVKPQSPQINHGFTATTTKTVIVVKPQSSQINHGFTATTKNSYCS